MNTKDIEIKESEILNNEILEQNEDLKQAKQDPEGNLLTTQKRYVECIAKLYEDQGLSHEELISAGNKGLITAVERYRPNPRFRFVAYAVWWIRESIQEALKRISKNNSQ